MASRGAGVAGKGVSAEGQRRIDEKGRGDKKEKKFKVVLGLIGHSKAEHRLPGGERENATNAIFGRLVQLCRTTCNVR